MKKESVNGATWGYRKRRDLPLITPPMMKVLLALRAAAEADSPFIHLHVHGSTIKSLLDRDWIFASPGSDGTRYKVTGRGLNALKVYEPTLRRTDGICPECGKNPKHIRSSGEVDGYCIGCLRKQAQRERRLGINHKNPDALCPRCKQRPRYRQPGGEVITWCKECDRERKREAKREKRRQQLELVHAGGFIKCRKADCQNCVHFTGKSVYDMCPDHLRAYMNEYHDRIRPDSAVARARRQKAARR